MKLALRLMGRVFCALLACMLMLLIWYASAFYLLLGALVKDSHNA